LRAEHSNGAGAKTGNAIPRRRLLGAIWLLPAWWHLGGANPTNQLVSSEPTNLVTVVRFSPDGEPTGEAAVPKVIKSDAQWRRLLTPEQYWVTRRGVMERPFAGQFASFRGRGLYTCVCCANTLFSSQTKYEAGTGWASFWAPVATENVRLRASSGVRHPAVLCVECDAFVGQLFADGPPPTHRRYSISSAALNFREFPRA